MARNWFALAAPLLLAAVLDGFTLLAVDDLWSGQRVQRWLHQAAGLDRQFAQVSGLVFDAAGLTPGEAVLDVGCGTGSATRAAAVAVGTGGRVTGLDVSADMLSAAAGVAGGGAVEWLEADVVSWEPTAMWDVVISRFGVMFFSEPLRAFTNLARAVRPGGRLCAAVWSRRGESELFALPLRAAVGVLTSVELPPDDGGPFSLSEDSEVIGMLNSAGWSEVVVAKHQLSLPFCGGLPVAEASVAALDFGPLRTVAEHLDEADRARVIAAVAEAMAEHVDSRGHVWLKASVRILTARRGVASNP